MTPPPRANQGRAPVEAAGEQFIEDPVPYPQGLELLAVRELVLNGSVGRGLLRIVGVLGHQDSALGAIDVLLDQGFAVSGDDLACLAVQAGHGADPRVTTQGHAGIAVVMLDEEGEGKISAGAFDVGGSASEQVRRCRDALGSTGRFHLLTGRLVEARSGAGERNAELLESFYYLDARFAIV